MVNSVGSPLRYYFPEFSYVNNVHRNFSRVYSHE